MWVYKGYPLSVIQTILRHASPNTTARYIHSLGLEETRGALEEGLKGPARVIEFPKAANSQKKPPEGSAPRAVCVRTCVRAFCGSGYVS